jgi:hypothetical protein
MATLTTVVSSSPPNFGIGDTFSWVKTEGANRPLYARAVYLTNASDMSVSLSANELNMNMEDVENLLKAQLGQQGFDFIVGGQTASSGPYTTVQIASAAKISAITASSSTIGQLTAFELPANFSFNGPITSITLQYGAAFVYKL